MPPWRAALQRARRGPGGETEVSETPVWVRRFALRGSKKTSGGAGDPPGGRGWWGGGLQRAIFRARRWGGSLRGSAARDAVFGHVVLDNTRDERAVGKRGSGSG